MRCGEIVLLSYPFTDDSAVKVRPALIVSADSFNRGEDVVVVPISSARQSPDPYAQAIRQEDPHFPETGLRQTSYVKWTKPFTTSKRMATRRLGRLHAEPLRQVRSKIQEMFN